MLSRRAWVTIKSATNKVIKHMNVELRPCTLEDLKDIVITIRSMDIELLSVDPTQYGHQTRKKGKEQWQLLKLGL